jgi:DNA-binding transcriptional LysR family regulator
MFVQVVRSRSFTEAARQLRVPPNTLSRRIRQLEVSLDTRLMQRSTRKLTLTTAGQAFYDRCAASVDGMLQAGKDLIDGSQTQSGLVRIAAPADFLDLFPLEWVAEFLQLHPMVRLDFVLNDARADLIAEGIDVAFRGGSVPDTATVYRPIAAQYFMMVASPRYLATRGTPQTLQDLPAHDCLTGLEPHNLVTWTLLGPEGSEDVRVSGRIRVNTSRILVRSCVAGLGIALVPSMLIATDLRAGRLVRVLPDYRREGADLNILVPSRQQVPLAVAAFIEFAAQKLRSIMADTECPPVSTTLT